MMRGIGIGVLVTLFGVIALIDFASKGYPGVRDELFGLTVGFWIAALIFTRPDTAA